MSLDGFTEEVFRLALYQHEEFLRHPKVGPELVGRTGGYLCVFNPRRMAAVTQLIGRIPEGKDPARYASLSVEKAVRLFSHPGHMLSRQSENEALGQFAGAVRGKGRPEEALIISYSGDPGHIDELKSMGLLVKTNNLDRDLAMQILRENPNNYFRPTPGVEDFFLDF